MTSIAERAEVSVAVVSRLLRGDPTLRISEQRRQQIFRISTELGGVKARVRKRRLTHAVMVPINRIFSPASIKIVLSESEQFRCLEAKLKSQGFRLHMSFFDPGEELHIYESLVRQPRACDGVLVLSGVANEELAQLLGLNRMPHVAFDSDAERYAINTVRVQNAEGVRQAVAHLHELGHRNIGFVGPRDSNRYPLMVAAQAGLQLSMDELFNCWIPLISEPTQENWRQATIGPFSQWLTRRPASALICSNDAIAYGVMDAMARAGLRVGVDLSLVGHDNTEERGSLRTDHPILTTLDNPTDKIGNRAAELLLNQILHGQTQIVHERLPARLIVRGSTGPCVQ